MDRKTCDVILREIKWVKKHVIQFNGKNRTLTSSKTRLMNLNDSKRVRVISATGTPIYLKGSINHRIANASCSGVVVARQRLTLWKTF